MKKIMTLTAGAALLLLPSCIQEFEPQQVIVTEDQASSAPGAYENFVNSLTSSVAGQWVFDTPKYRDPNDFGYPSLILMREMTGNDMVAVGGRYNWFQTWYTSYAQDKTAPTVPIVSNDMSISGASNNPRATYEDMMKFILADLDNAERFLSDYSRRSKEEPDMSVVNGLRARVYLLMEDWVNAEKYAKEAQKGYTVMTGAEYNNKVNGFNNANSNNAWLWCCTFKKDDACMVTGGNHSWGSWMINELPNDGQTGYGYYSKYGAGNYIDYHLYQTIPASDTRKQCYVDFEIDKKTTATDVIKALAAYSDVPEYVFNSGNAVRSNTNGANAWGGMPLKFRGRDGNHTNNQEAYCVDVPLMRVEEMVLIEAEAAGRQDENRGKALLETFAKTRDENYVYGKHNDAYNNSSTSPFINEIWWQRRVEFWGEGLAMFDIKRLNKGIIRSYAGTNHVDGYRWNTNEPPQWMTFCIVQTETNNNSACTNNPTPIAPKGNSPEHAW